MKLLCVRCEKKVVPKTSVRPIKQIRADCPICGCFMKFLNQKEKRELRKYKLLELARKSDTEFLEKFRE